MPKLKYPLPDLKYIQNSDGFSVYLQSDLVFYSDKFGEIIIPAGFHSDGASVPKFLWNIFPPFGKYLYSAIIHDYFCVLGAIKKPTLNSKEAALLFLESMTHGKVGYLKSRLMFSAVRLFGPKF